MSATRQRFGYYDGLAISTAEPADNNLTADLLAETAQRKRYEIAGFCWQLIAIFNRLRFLILSTKFMAVRNRDRKSEICFRQIQLQETRQENSRRSKATLMRQLKIIRLLANIERYSLGEGRRFCGMGHGKQRHTKHLAY